MLLPNVYHLKYFVDAAESGSVSAAARKNLVSQSAVTQAIRALEQTLGTSLALHQRNRFELTDSGRETLNEARAVLMNLEGLKARLESNHGEPSGALCVGASASIAEIFLAPQITGFYQQYPKVNLSLCTGIGETIQEWLLKRDIDIGLIADSKIEKGVESIVLRKGEYVLVGPLDTCRTSWQEYGIVAASENNPERMMFAESFRRHFKKELPVKASISSWSLMKRFVLANCGAALVPDYVVEQELKSKQLFAIPMPFAMPTYTLQVVLAKGRYLPRNAQLFLASVFGTCAWKPMDASAPQGSALENRRRRPEIGA